MIGLKKPVSETRVMQSHPDLEQAPLITTPLPGPRAKAYIERDHRHSSPSYTRDYPLVVERACGCVVEDVDGNRWLDFAAGIAVCSTGHAHPKVVSAIEQQARKLMHICGSDFYYPVMIELLDKLAALLPGAENRVLLTNSGTEAVEAAFKLARHHTKRKWAIAFHGAFHGRTMGALALTCSKARQKEGFGPLVPMTAHVPFGDASAIENDLFKYHMTPGEVAAIFVEAIQGEGGYRLSPPGFLSDLRKLCDKHGILLVCDEIQSGMGRTGKWWAYEHFGITPDIVVTAKGLASGMPLGAVITRKEIMDWPPGAQGSTFGGNPVSCAAAVATIELLEEGYLANAGKLGPLLIGKLRDLAAKKKTVANPRGLGLMCGIDIVNPKSGTLDPTLREQILQAAFARGLILLGCGESSIRVCPPLCVSEREIDLSMNILDSAIPAL